MGEGGLLGGCAPIGGRCAPIVSTQRSSGSILVKYGADKLDVLGPPPATHSLISWLSLTGTKSASRIPRVFANDDLSAPVSGLRHRASHFRGAHFALFSE